MNDKTPKIPHSSENSLENIEGVLLHMLADAVNFYVSAVLNIPPYKSRKKQIADLNQFTADCKAQMNHFCADASRDLNPARILRIKTLENNLTFALNSLDTLARNIQEVIISGPDSANNKLRNLNKKMSNIVNKNKEAKSANGTEINGEDFYVWLDAMLSVNGSHLSDHNLSTYAQFALSIKSAHPIRELISHLIALALMRKALREIVQSFEIWQNRLEEYEDKINKAIQTGISDIDDLFED